ncbi:MAG TPA: M28 family metallopeptidase [Gemmatimonadaceae bacterium]|nr:M28 family metallopeptidase [Gemmatimonadaceae bacterium]
MARSFPLFVVCLLLLAARVDAQTPNDSQIKAADQLIDAALRDSAAYRRLGELVDRFGHRLAGSRSLERAIDWVVAEMKKDGLENVRTQPAMVTHWVRGTEAATLISPRQMRLPMLGLGRSIGTRAQGITAPVLVVHDFAELRMRAAEVKGKIVVYDFPFDSTRPNFDAYGEAVRYRSSGADSAAQFGAVAVLVRSVTPHSLQTPHTGGMSYGDSTRRIPAAAITVEHAAMLHRMQDRGERIVVRLVMGARNLPKTRSRNVIAEVRGSERPEQVVVIGGHIDSWDVGQGAMDDGGGCVAAWEALRLIKQLGIRPKRTIRAVLWTAEEVGLDGARAYADSNASTIDNHILAMESDNGVFQPTGLSIAGTDSTREAFRAITPLLRRIGVDSLHAGDSPPDVIPLHRLGVPAAELTTVGSRYFWYHHTDADMLDKLDPVELAKNVAGMAVVAFTVANMDQRIPRAPIAAASP